MPLQPSKEFQNGHVLIVLLIRQVDSFSYVTPPTLPGGAADLIVRQFAPKNLTIRPAKSSERNGIDLKHLLKLKETLLLEDWHATWPIRLAWRPPAHPNCDLIYRRVVTLTTSS
jgi:hypothetical protein